MQDGFGGFPSRYASPRRVAAGGMGEIFVAEDTTLGRRVAIKLLSDRFSRDEGVKRRFTREALAAARLSGHPHIVTIYDVGDAGGRPFIVMEYLAGGTVADRARSGPVQHEQALAWLREAADALDHAHENGIVHRDVKPANMLLDERGELHMGDFGIARVIDETTSGMTVAGTVLGTAGYLSPEQARGEPASAASDVYGLAVVAYELLTGGRPFEGGSATAEAAAHIHQPVPPASERSVGLPREIDAVFDRALAKHPAARHPAAREFVDDLAGALTRREPTWIPPAAAPAAPTRRAEPAFAGRPPERDRSRAWLPLVAGLVIAAGVAGVVLAATVAGGDDDPPATTRAQPQSQAQPAPQKVTVTQTLEGTTVEETATVTVESEPPAPPSSPPPPAAGGSDLSLGEAKELTDQATFAMRDGDYVRAVALAESALTRLRGSGDIYEAYAYYDAGASYAALGQCGRALDYLNRSEAIQGHRTEIDRARGRCR